MTVFKVKVTRCRKIYEEGYLEVEAESIEQAEELAGEMDDPDEMEEINSTIESCIHDTVEEVDTSEAEAHAFYEGQIRKHGR